MLDVRGAVVHTASIPAGRTSGTYRWDGRNNAGRQCADGVYYIRMESESGHATRAVSLLR
ncbi:MAG: FlgD immunoglobulin-like domain containing protein [Gemmatimonadota bacterium]|nr:FlgD immunoglobulin-like domain containing protein [Gemmatimonadota bacterium]MDP6803119.1 FlgD immunoglobulin-like domain containing protein [Gemmatimonadota bacterium]MDP7031898.1 FlgD immunoglobulin-like domain containing protein [Gemmatimonadota bacterium]